MNRQAIIAQATWLVLCLLMVTTLAWAQGDPGDTNPDADRKADGLDDNADLTGTDPAPGDRPWAEGVSPEDQEAARVLFYEGNALLKDSLFLPAVEKYRAALQHWEHPGIHYNLVLALLNMDQPIEVYHSLQKAMQYGVGPLDKDKYERAQSYLKLVEKQLARIEIVCDLPAAKVALDGQFLFTGPGRYEGLVRAGDHNVVATKRGYITADTQISLSPGEQKHVELRLFTVDEMTISKRRWAEWKPWSALGAGTAVALAGGLLHWRSSVSFDSFDSAFNKVCQDGGGMDGCRDEDYPDLSGGLTRARWQQRIAVASYAVGGTAMAAGLVLIYLNRPQLFRREIHSHGETGNVSILPWLVPDTAGVSAGFRF